MQDNRHTLILNTTKNDENILSLNSTCGHAQFGSQIFPVIRDAWAVHYTSAWNETFLAGDGGSKTSVAHSDRDQWIYRYDYPGTHNSLGGTIPDSKDSTYTIVADSLRVERLVNMKNHNYNLEPNVHFSPDNRFVIFRANFEGYDNIYAVEL